MTNEERKQAIEWLKNRQITMPGAKKMFALAVEALEAYVPDMNGGDMISRQAAIYIASGYCHPANIAKELAKLPSAQPETQWIPCSERLPERGEDVLVTRDYDGRKDNNKSCRYVEVASCYGEDDDITWSSFF